MPEEKNASRRLRPKERRYYTDEGVDEDEIEGRRNFSIDDKLRTTRYNKEFVLELKGSDVNLRYFQENGFTRPILVREKSGLGMRIPSKEFNVSDVKQCVGSRRSLDVMDVNTQKALEMTMKEWTKYYENKNRTRLLNVISLEFSHTKLENYVEQPTVVKQIDWIDTMWPRFLKESQSEATNVLDKMKYPKVQKYCLMSVKGCYTDFHIDMGGTSVWYHILHGQKIFWLIPPTEANLRMYEEWTLSAKQGDVFFADKVRDCQRVLLEEGHTFFIPTGWIHAVYTPEDSLVFGGNFLHTFNVPMQLRVWEVESRTHVPSKFRYPFFTEIHWYVLERYVHCVTGRQHRIKSVRELKQEEEDEIKGPAGETRISEVDCKSEASSGSSEARAREFSPPQSPVDVDHCYGRPSRPTTPRTPGECVSPRPLGLSQPGPPGPPAMIKMSPEDLISPVSVKLENCMASLGGTPLAGTPPGGSPDFKRSSSHPGSPPPAAPPPGAPSPQAEVHMTGLELEGLRCIVAWLENLQPGKKQVPKDILEPSALLNDAKRMIWRHENDDPKLAITGVPIVKWPSRKKSREKHSRQWSGPSKPPTPKASRSITPRAGRKHDGGRRRRVRCKKCGPCTSGDCGICVPCKDMKRHGGPGKLKKTCVARQCNKPVLAFTTVCLLCGADETENHKNSAVTMMECSVCWEIVHPRCLQDKTGLADPGIISQTLPNSWECPKCAQKIKQPQAKDAVVKDEAQDERVPTATSPTLSESPTEGMPSEPPSPSTSPLPQQQDKDELSNGHTQDKSTSCAADDNLSPGGDGEKQERTPGKRSRSKKPPTPEESPTSPKRVKMEPVVKLEQVRVDQIEPRRTRSSPPGPSPTPPPSRDLPPPLRELRDRDGARTTSRGRETGGGSDDGDSGGSSRTSSGSRSPSPGPSRGREGGGGGGGTGGGGDGGGGPGDSGGGDGAGTPGGKRPRDPSSSDPGSHGNVPVKQCKVVVHKYVVRPAPLAPAPRYCPAPPPGTPALDRDLWIRIFSYLPLPARAAIMAVCKTWHRWSLDPRLWRSLDLSRRRLRQHHLVAIVMRQPRNLDISWTNISRRQLEWLAARLPQLKSLNLSGNSWPGVSALASSSCPLLTSINLNWVTGVFDACVRDLVSPPIDHKPGVDDSVGRLHRCTSLSIAGADIGDATLEVIVRNLPSLTRLDLSYCSKITNTGLRLLCCGEGNRLDLHELDLTGCHHLTDQCFQFLTFLRNLRRLSVQGCQNITLEGCQHYIQHAPNRRLQMAEDRRFETV